VFFDSARKAIASLTKKVTKKATSKKKSKDVETSKRCRKDDTSEEEEEPDNPNDSDFDPTDEAASASFMVDEDEINQGGGNNDDIIDVINYTAPRRQWTLLTNKRRIPLRSASVRTPHLFHHRIPKVLVNPRSKGITSVIYFYALATKTLTIIKIENN
jgi:hypothetical protein